MWTIWLIYFLAASAASVVAISIGWRGQQTADGEAGSHFHRLADMSSRSAVDVTPAGLPGESSVSDAADIIRRTAHGMVPAIERQRVTLDLAAEPGQFVRMRPGVLAALVEDLIALGLHAAVGGHLLLTAVRSGSRIDIVLSDDQAVDGVSLRQSQARDLAQRVALHGGALAIVAKPGLGTTMTLKLTAATERQHAMEIRRLAEQTV